MYSSRSLFDEEEVDGGSLMAGSLRNESSSQPIVAVIYHVEDTVQVVHVEKKRIAPSCSVVFDCLVPLHSPRREFHLHVHFPGLMGFISPRTQLSSGYGFRICAGNSYRICLIPRDAKGNKCAIFREGASGPAEVVESKSYKFGDMLLKPGLNLFKQILTLNSLNLSPDTYAAYLRRHQSASIHDSDNDNISHSLENETSPSDNIQDVDEIEAWGLFFHEVKHLGITFCVGDESGGIGKWITQDDIDMQEPFLFIGLPACALFGSIFRSFKDGNGILLLDGRRIVLANCPTNFKQMFELLMQTKKSLLEVLKEESGVVFDQQDILWMQQFLLYSSSSHEISLSNVPSDERQNQLRNALSHLVGVCIQLTQQPYFKENFLQVLDSISSHIDSMKS